MRVLQTTDASAMIELTYDELVIVYSGLVEAMEALSEGEFLARVGRTEGSAAQLALLLKNALLGVEAERSDQ